MASTQYYTVLGVTLTWSQFCLWETTYSRLYHGYAAFGVPESMHIQVRRPGTKLWLFDALLKPIISLRGMIVKITC